MSTGALFQPPTPEPRSTGHSPGHSSGRADFIQVDTALNSMRDSGFDLTAAAGEPIDNSYEAGARIIRVINTFGRGKRSIDAIAFADDGRGIDPTILAHVLSMGYSTRYGKRGGLGRFGVGLKLAGLSLGKRIDVYSKQSTDDQIHHAYIDLDEIKAGKQTFIEAEPVADWPEAYRDAMRDRTGTPFRSGTLVIYGKIDRLSSGGTYGTSLDEKISDLRTFIARAYRKFLDKGLVIELDGKPVTLLDPLFLMDNPRIIERYRPADPRGKIVDETDLEIEGHKVHVIVALAPEEFRPREGTGGEVDSQNHNIREFQINAEKAGRISMIRNGREINYDIVPRLLPSGIDKPDRYFAIEVSFPAELDEYFQVRNVKRGAVPVNKLRQELREWLQRPVKQARAEIRRLWNEVETRERATSGAHDAVTDAVARAEKTAPLGQAGQDVTAQEAEQIITDLLTDLQLDSADTSPEEIREIREQIDQKPITLVDGNWAGKELFEIQHLNGKAIVKLNHRHPLIRDVYDPLKKVANDGADRLDVDDLLTLARKAEIAFDVLFLAYAKAENMHRNPDEQYDHLRSYWGQFSNAYLREAMKNN